MNTMFEVNPHDTEYIDFIERMSESYRSENFDDFVKSPVPEIESSLSPPKTQSQHPVIKSQSKIKEAASEIQGGFGLKFTRVGQQQEYNDEDNYFDQFDDNEENENKKNIINEIYQQHVMDRYQSVHKRSVYAVPTQMPSVSKKISLLGDFRKSQSILESRVTNRSANPSNKSSSIQNDPIKFDDEDKKPLISAHDFHISPETLADTQKYLDIVYTKLAAPTERTGNNYDPYNNISLENLRRESVKHYLDQVYLNLEQDVLKQRPSLVPKQSVVDQVQLQKAGQYVQGVYKQVIGDFLKQKKPHLKEELLSNVYTSDRSIGNSEFVVNGFLEQLFVETSKILSDSPADQTNKKTKVSPVSTQNPPKRSPVDLKALAEDNLSKLMMTSDIIRNSVREQPIHNMSSSPTDIKVDSKKARFDKIKEIKRTFRKSRADVLQSNEDILHNLIAQQNQKSIPSTPSSKESPRPTFDLVIESDEYGNDKLGVIFKDPVANQAAPQKSEKLPQIKVLPLPENNNALHDQNKEQQQTEFFVKKELREVEGILSVSNNQGPQSQADSFDQNSHPSNKVIVREFEKNIMDAIKKLRPPGTRVKFIAAPGTSNGNISLGDAEPNKHRFKNLPILNGRSQSNEQTKRDALRNSGYKDDSIITAKSESVIHHSLLKPTNVFEPDYNLSPPRMANDQSPIFKLRRDSNVTNNDDKSTPLFGPNGFVGHNKYLKESLSNFTEDKLSLKNLPIKTDSPAVELESGKITSEANPSGLAEQNQDHLTTPHEDHSSDKSDRKVVSLVKLDNINIKKSEVIQRVLVKPRGSRAHESYRSIDFPEVTITMNKHKSPALAVNSPEKQISLLQSSNFIKPTDKVNELTDSSKNGVARKNSVEIEERNHRTSRVTVTNRQSMAKRQSIFPNEPILIHDEEEYAPESKSSFIPKSRKITPLDDETRLKIEIEYKMRCAERMNTILSKSRFTNGSETESMLKDEMKKMVSVDFLMFVHAIAKDDQDKIIPLQRMVRKMINKKIMAKITLNNKMYREMKTSIEARRTRLTSFISRKSSASSKKYYG